MQFPTNDIRRDWMDAPKLGAKHSALLKKVLHTIDTVTQLTHGYELMITSFMRPNDLKSYHSIGQGVDIRTWDMPVGLRPLDHRAMFMMSDGEILELLRKFKNHDKQVQHQFEPQILGHHPESGKITILKGEHIHIEVDDNSLSKEDA